MAPIHPTPSIVTQWIIEMRTEIKFAIIKAFWLA